MSSTKEQLIRFFKDRPNVFISSEKMSQTLDASHEMIKIHIKELKQDGYVIEEHLLGFRMIQVPKNTSQSVTENELKTTWLGNTITRKEITESTQEDAKKAANERYPHGSVFVANTQTNGKGRLGRSWHSTNNKGIWMSILLRPNLLPQQASLLTLLSATVLADVLTHRTNQNIAIKWPN